MQIFRMVRCKACRNSVRVQVCGNSNREYQCKCGHVGNY